MNAPAVANIVNAAEAPAWPTPEPLVSKIESAPYPDDALPDRVRAAVMEVQSFIKAPVPLVASCALSALSLAIQAHHDARRDDKLDGPTSLFLLAIADSGERKSTCDRFFMQAIHDHEKLKREEAAPLVKQFDADMKAWEAKRAGIADAIKQQAKADKSTANAERTLRDLEAERPEAPKVARLVYGDVTPEELARCLARQWPSAGVVSAEAGVVFGSHGMGKDAVMRNLALLNVLWDGARLTIDRKTSESLTVEGARLTVALQIQEATLREFFKAAGVLARGSGFLARFLIAWPESTMGSRGFTEAPAAWPALAVFNRRITELLNIDAPMTEQGTLEPLPLSFTPDAKAAWIAFYNAIECELGEGGDLRDVRDVASKTADNAARLAALFQVFEIGAGSINAEMLERAARIAAWHLSESRRFFGELAIPVELANAARLDDWLIGYCRREHTHIVPRREIQRCGPNGLRDRNTLDAALRELVELRRVRDITDGKRRDIYINPALLGGGV